MKNYMEKKIEEMNKIFEKQENIFLIWEYNFEVKIEDWKENSLESLSNEYNFIEVFKTKEEMEKNLKSTFRIMKCGAYSYLYVETSKFLEIKKEEFKVFKDDEEKIERLWELEGIAEIFRKEEMEEEILLSLLKKQMYYWKYISLKKRDNTAFMLKAVEDDGYSLEYASDRLRDNKEIVLTAIESEAMALEYASDRLRDDEEVVRKAYENDDYSLKYASDRLKKIFGE